MTGANFSTQTVRPVQARRTEWYGLPGRYWMLWLAVLVLWTGRFVTPFLASYLTTDIGVDAQTTGLVISAYGFGGVLASLFGGALSDRWGRLPIIVIGQIGSAIMLVVLAMISEPVPMAAALFVYGAIGQMGGPALSAYIADLVPPARRERAYSLQVWAMNCGFAIGPIIATALAKVAFVLIFYVEAVTLTLIALILMVVLRGKGSKGRKPAARVVATSDTTMTTGDGISGAGDHDAAEPVSAGDQALTTVPPSQGLREGYRAVLTDRVFLTFVLLMIGYTLVYFQNTSGLPIAMGERGLSMDDYAKLLTINGALLCLFQIPMIRVIEKFDKSLVLVVALLLTAIGFGLQIIATSWTLFAVATILWTVGELGTFPVASTTVANLAPKLYRGTYQGIYNLTWSLSHGLAPLIGGAVIHAASGPALWTGCTVFLLLIAAGVFFSRHSRDAREQDGKREAQAEHDANLQEHSPALSAQ